MNPNLPPALRSTLSFFRHPLALFGGVLLCLAPELTSAQSVSFVGAQTTVSNSSVGSIVVDSLGNLFGIQGNNVVKMTKTATGYGPPIILPFSGISPYLLAVDNEDDVFTIDASTCCNFLELPWTGSGYGPQISLPNVFTYNSYPGGLAVDTAGNLFFTDNVPDPPYLSPDWNNGVLFELPKSATGYGSPIALYGAPGFDSFGGVAVDGAGDEFINEQYLGDPNCESGCPPSFNFAEELPKTGTGFGQPIGLPVSGFDAVDGAGNLYVNYYTGVAEIPNTGTGFGPQTVLPIGGFCQQLAVDSTGNIFFPTCEGSIVEFQRQSVNFGSVNLCTSGAPAPCSETVSLHYNVTASGTLGTPKVLTGGAPNLDFTLASGSTCTGAVTANSSCAVHVTFRPQAAGARNGTVEITDRSGNVLATTAISGIGAGAPGVQLSPTYLPFGAVPVGSSETLPVTVTNIGGGTLTITTSISGTSNYSIASSTCGSGVTAGNGCLLQVQFSPTSVSTTHDGLLTIQTDGGNATVALAGTGSGLSVFGGVNGAALKFGSVSSGSTKVLPLTITNVGLPGTVTVGTAIKSGPYTTSPYTILTTSQNTCQAGIAAGQSCTLPVEFYPTSSGVHDDLLTLTPNPSDEAEASTVWLLGSTP